MTGAGERVQFLERRLAAVTRWLEEHKPEVFREGLWDAVHEAGRDEGDHGGPGGLAGAASEGGRAVTRESAGGSPATSPSGGREARTLDDLLGEIHDAEHAYRDAVEATLPINTWVTVKHGDNRTGVWVIGHAYGRVKVRNPDSGAEYWVDASRLVEHETFRLRATPTETGGEDDA